MLGDSDGVWSFYTIIIQLVDEMHLKIKLEIEKGTRQRISIY